MDTKYINTRIQIKHDTKARWDAATSFTPLEGELIFYTDLNKIKIGDGKTLLPKLPFISVTKEDINGDSYYTESEIDSMIAALEDLMNAELSKKLDTAATIVASQIEGSFENSLTPKTSNEFDLGTEDATWKDLHLDGDIKLTANSTLTDGTNSSKLADIINHNHDKTYYTKTWIDTELAKLPKENTTYEVSASEIDGQIKITPSNGQPYNVAVTGLGSAAYTETSIYSKTGHNHDDKYYTESEIDTKLAEVRAENTTYELSSGDSNGQIKVTPNKGNEYNISVTGLASAAFTESSDYAAAIHNHDESYYTKSQIDTELAKLPKENTTYTLSEGANNGQIKVTPSNGEAYNISPKGLGSAAYTSSDDYASSNHDHNNIYYTENEIDTKLASKADTGHTHSIVAYGLGDDVISISGEDGDDWVGYTVNHAKTNNAGTYTKVEINDYGHVINGTNPTTLTGYGITDAYTKVEVDSELVKKSNSHDHPYLSNSTKYAGANIQGGSAISAVKLDSDAGSTVQPIYFKDGKPTATTYTLNKSVPADAKFTDTTYESKTAVNNGTAESLVTTGEKYTWNNKADTTTATSTVNGLMSATDKTNLDKLVTAWTADGTDNTLVNKVEEVLKVFENYPESANMVTVLSGKADVDHGTHVTTATVKQALGTGSGTSKYLREDGTWVTPPNTTYSSKSAKESGTEISLVTTGEKYNWNNKASAIHYHTEYVTNEYFESYTDYAENNYAQAKNLATVATSGSYDDLSSKPTISNATITIKQTGKSDQTFTLNGNDTTITLNDTDTTYPVLDTNKLGIAKVFNFYTNSAVFAGGNIPQSPDTTNTRSVNSITSTSGRYYGVEADKDGRLFVNVPWTDTNTHDGNDNQKIKAGTTTFEINDTIDFVAGDNVSITGDATNKKITIASSYANTTYDLSAPANKENGSVTINLTAGGSGSGTDSVQIKGSGATTVTSNSSGVITINSTNTTYGGGSGISISGGLISNSGVRSISTGSTNGTISVNTGGTSAEVTVKGLGSAAYTDSTAYAAASHGTHVTAATVKSALGTGTGTSKYLREDGTWVTPPNTTYSAGTGLALSGTTFSVKTGYTTSGQNYKVQTDTSGNLFVNVPWTDTNTTYTFNGAVSTIKDSNLTSHRALVSNADGKVAASTVTSTELSYLSGVTSDIQTQLGTKLSTSGGSMTGSICITGGVKAPYIHYNSGSTSITPQECPGITFDAYGVHYKQNVLNDAPSAANEIATKGDISSLFTLDGTTLTINI